MVEAKKPGEKVSSGSANPSAEAKNPPQAKGPPKAKDPSGINSRLQASAKRHQRLATFYIFLALSLAIGGVLYFSFIEGDAEKSLKDTLTEWESKTETIADNIRQAEDQRGKAQDVTNGFYSAIRLCKAIVLNETHRDLIDTGTSNTRPEAWRILPAGIVLKGLSGWSMQAGNSSENFQSGPAQLHNIVIPTCGIPVLPGQVDQSYKQRALGADIESRRYYGAYDFDSGAIDRLHTDYIEHGMSLRSLEREPDTLVSALRAAATSISQQHEDNRIALQKKLDLLNEGLIGPLKERLKPKPELSEYDIINGIVVRIGSISLALYLLALFLGFARYHTRMANFYEARGHAIRTAQMLAPESVPDVLKTLDPEKIMFTKEPNLPLDRVLKIAEAIKK